MPERAETETRADVGPPARPRARTSGRPARCRTRSAPAQDPDARARLTDALD